MSSLKKRISLLFKDSQGISLFELLIVITLSSLIGAALISFLVKNSGLFYQQNAQINQEISQNNTLDQLRSAILSAAYIASGYPVASPEYTTGTNVLVLAVPSIDASGLVISNTYDYIVFTKDPQKPTILRKFIFPDTLSKRKSENRVLTTRLSNIFFYYFDKSGNVVSPTTASQIKLVMNQLEKAGLADQQSSESAQVNLRNN
jgi:type II secretory pathway pseudopilin PulG